MILICVAGYLNKEVGQVESLFKPSDILIGGSMFVVVAAFVESIVVIALTSGESKENKVGLRLSRASCYRVRARACVRVCCTALLRIG